MLQLTIPGREDWDEKANEFVATKETTLQLEHSLVSVSKWESKWCVPFLTKQDKTVEQTIDYVRCMTLTQHVDPNVYHNLTPDNLKAVFDYIDAPMTATTIGERRKKKGGRRQIITSELIYYWMTAFNIPFECQKWHLNRLIMLIRVCEAEQQPEKPLSQKALMRRNAALNAARKKKYHTRG